MSAEEKERERERKRERDMTREMYYLTNRPNRPSERNGILIQIGQSAMEQFPVYGGSRPREQLFSKRDAPERFVAFCLEKASSQKRPMPRRHGAASYGFIGPEIYRAYVTAKHLTGRKCGRQSARR